MYPGDAGNIGIDFAGIIIQSASKKFNTGDKVIGLSFGSYASHLIANEDLLIKTDLSFDRAAALPLTSITAIYCLEKIGKIKKDDNILIHAGAGGVGLCAIQYAQWKGANIFSTVGSKEKEDYLISIGIDKKNIKSSRNSDFKFGWENKFDIILNSLSFLNSSLITVKHIQCRELVVVLSVVSYHEVLRLLLNTRPRKRIMVGYFQWRYHSLKSITRH
jgi:D-arabinose 1-dehydrogenase-like Zn-dependent alcohol dehydrogenase